MGNLADRGATEKNSVPRSEATSPPLLTVDNPNAPRSRSIRNFAVFILCNVVLVNLAILAGDRLLATHFANPQTLPGIAPTFFVLSGHQGNDSLGVMLPVVHAFQRDPNAHIYESAFFEQHTKFQYPLTSLLPVYGLMRLGASDTTISQIFKAIAFLSVGLTIYLCFRLAQRLLRRCRTADFSADLSRTDQAILAAAFVLGGLFYYPLVSGLSLGQIQAVLTCGFTVAFLCWISGRELAASIVMGLMTAVKPQYGLFFVWALARRKFGIAAAGLCCLGIIGAVSLAVFGWHNNVEYFHVLRYIAPRGEGFFENQSVNGLLNRLTFNGNNMTWDANSFAPQNTIVSAGTTISSLLLLGLALFYRWGKDRAGSAIDFACMILASTMASPVAWVHHYAILLPVLVWLWFGHYGSRNSRWSMSMLAIAYILMSNKCTTANFLAPLPVWNLLQSYFYFATILVLILLLKSNNDTHENHLSPVSPETAP